MHGPEPLVSLAGGSYWEQTLALYHQMITQWLGLETASSVSLTLINKCLTQQSKATRGIQRIRDMGFLTKIPRSLENNSPGQNLGNRTGMKIKGLTSQPSVTEGPSPQQSLRVQRDRGRPERGGHRPPGFGPHAFPLTLLGPEANWQWRPHLQEKQRGTASSQ